MAQIENKFLYVISVKDAEKYLTQNDLKIVNSILAKISRGRFEDGKEPCNSYWVCNQDEPYADDVIDLIIQGEKRKEQEK